MGREQGKEMNMTPEALARVLANYFLLPVDDLMRGPMGRNLVPKLLAAITPAPAPMTPPSERALKWAHEWLDGEYLKMGEGTIQAHAQHLDAFAAEAVRAAVCPGCGESRLSLSARTSASGEGGKAKDDPYWYADGENMIPPTAPRP